MTWLTNPFRFGPPAIPLTAVPYWRLQVLSTRNVQGAINKFEMASSPGGGDLCTGGTASANPETSSAASSAFDASDGTFWNSGIRCNGAWLQYQFATSRLIQEIRVKSRNDAFFADAPRVFALLASSDGVTFKGAGILRIPSAWTQNQVRTFAIPNTETPNLRSQATIWGITVTDSANGGRLYMAEMEMALTTSGADQCTGGFAFHRAAATNAEASENLFDNTNSLCQARDWVDVAQPDFGYIFATPINPVELRLTAASTFGLQTNMAKDFTIWWSSDGVNRTTVRTITGQTGWASGETRAFSIP